MVRMGAAWLAITLLAGLGGCDSGVRKDAAKGAQPLFAAVVARDRVAFEKVLDRRAVREDLRGQLVAVARANGVEVDGGPSEFALDRMIQPEALRLVDAAGQPVAKAPTVEELAGRLKIEGKTRVCLTDAGKCQLTFAKSKGPDGKRWRLVGMRAQDLTVQVQGG